MAEDFPLDDPSEHGPWFFAAFARAGILVAGGIYGAIIATSPLPWAEIDQDGSGVVSLIEAIDAHDVGERPSARNPDCVEYFWFKDGLTAYEKCPN